MEHRPFLVTVLAGLQFLAVGACCIVLLGNATLDSELSPLEVGAAVGVALAGAIVVGSSLNGGRVGWALQVALALAAIGLGVVLVVDGQLPVVLAAGVVWLVLLVVPTHRRWFETSTAG